MIKNRRITDHWLRDLTILIVLNVLYIFIVSKIIGVL